MELLECIKTRSSTRSFKGKEVPEELVEKVLEAGIHAPSAGNSQDWEFIVVRDKKVKDGLVDAAHGQSFITEAPVVIIACGNKNRITSRYGGRGEELYMIQDTAAAIENMLLAAHSLGLGACWIGAFSEEKASHTLELPEHVRPLAIIPIGWPTEKPLKPNRMPVKEVVHYDGF